MPFLSTTSHFTRVSLLSSVFITLKQCQSCPSHCNSVNPVHNFTILSITLQQCQSCPQLHNPVHRFTTVSILSITLQQCQSCPQLHSPVHHIAPVSILSTTSQSCPSLYNSNNSLYRKIESFSSMATVNWIHASSQSFMVPIYSNSHSSSSSICSSCTSCGCARWGWPTWNQPPATSTPTHTSSHSMEPGTDQLIKTSWEKQRRWKIEYLEETVNVSVFLLST